MQTTAVLGGFFGDEAKAKIVDVLAKDVDVVVRFQGGNNAGHTIKFNNNKFVLHLVPSGIFFEKTVCVIGNGVVVDPISLKDELEALKSQGINFKNRFYIDPRVHIVLPYHKERDSRKDNEQGNPKIGTTGRGIGPCYSDKASRVGIRLMDLLKLDILSDKIMSLYRFHDETIDADSCKAIALNLSQAGDYLSEYINQVPYLLEDFRQQGKKILFEGAQGTLLDLDFGSYPFVTSSHTVSGGIAIGSGFAPHKIDRIVGVFKSYITRVGNGPLVTELKGEIGDRIREKGNEYGSSTGRPRRCGWFDAVAARYSALINGFDEVALTLLDVLQGFDVIKICYSYRINGKEYDIYPADTEMLELAEPVYREMSGWEEDLTQIRDFGDLPQTAVSFIREIEQLLKIPVTIVSVGPERQQTIFV
jgi:adenylosuccinate synthase